MLFLFAYTQYILKKGRRGEGKKTKEEKKDRGREERNGKLSRKLSQCEKQYKPIM